MEHAHPVSTTTPRERLSLATTWRALRKRKLVVFALILVVLSAPWFANLALQPIEFNQLLIDRVEIKYGASGVEPYVDLLRSTWLSGLHAMTSWPDRTPPPYSDTEAMFTYVFSWVPSRATVYPTEGYYYFSFPHPEEGLISGSLRLADLDQGYVTLNYFLAGKPSEDAKIVSAHMKRVTIDKRSDYDYVVAHRGKSIRFVFRDEAFIQRRPEHLSMLPEEQFVARMHDESGLRFFVLFNEATASFYYVLDDEQGTTDTFEPIGSNHIRGTRTGFIFYDEERPARKLLVGVSFASVKRNDFFDGPGDQVPFRLNLRDKLHRAYPSTMLGAGIDPHGVILKQAYWSRYLISAYHPYGSVENMLAHTETALAAQHSTTSDFWTALTKEWWHTKEWRERQYAKAEKEGHNVEKIIDRASRLLD